MIRIKKLISFDMDQNCILIYNDENMKGFLTDPGFDTKKIEEGIKDSGVEVTHILLTHCHYDHTFSVNKLREGRSLVCSFDCAENIKNSSRNLTFVTGEEYEIQTPDIILSDNEEIIINGIMVRAIYTPGHTNCSTCYLLDGILLSGDTLFKRNVGRWDLPTGDGEQLKSSIKNRLYTLPEDTLVLCGHGDDTTIGYEKKFNFIVN